MRMMTFAKRCSKEILRDPINLGFGLGFPLVLLVLLSAIQANIPVSLFEIDTLTPGITVFGLSFMTLFSATLIAKDRESALLQRLYTTDEPQRAIASFIILVGQDVMQSIAEQCKFCNDQRDQKWEKFHNLIHSLSPFRRFPHRSRDNRNRYRSVYGVSACVLPKTLP